MKVILSRKGFDSSAGGKPSPIIDNKLYSLPIPKAEDGMCYRDLIIDKNTDYLDMMRAFKDGHLSSPEFCRII